jgi:hypothetical protein
MARPPFYYPGEIDANNQHLWLRVEREITLNPSRRLKGAFFTVSVTVEKTQFSDTGGPLSESGERAVIYSVSRIKLVYHDIKARIASGELDTGDAPKTFIRRGKILF